jgi:hypothetical protein
MTACMQPGCTGAIVDGYCDVCGSPAGAVPYVPAAVLTTSAVPADEPNPTTVRREAGLPAEPRNENLNTACTQPHCTGMIIDRYCDVCGSPAGAVPYVPAATSAASAAHGDEPGSTAVRASTPAPAADEGRELAEIELDGAQDYRTRVQEAQLPDDVREAALCEVGKLERTNDQSSESGDIRTWLDTILDLPWGTRTTDWMDIQGSREVEATLRRLIEPAAADTAESGTPENGPAAADTAKIEPAAADDTDPPEAERAAAQTQPPTAQPEDTDTPEAQPATAQPQGTNTAPAGPHDDDTVEIPAVLGVLSGGPHPLPQLPEQQVLAPVPVQNRAKKGRVKSLVLAATALAALLIGALLLAASRDRGVTAQSVPTVTATATATATQPTSEPPDESTDTAGEKSTIQLEDLTGSAKPFETIRIQGTYRAGADTFLRVQRWEGGEWLDFPVPTKTEQSGQFTAYVELGQPGNYRLRVLDPVSGVKSKTFVVVITG